MDEENKNIEEQAEVIKPVEQKNVADNKPNGEGKGFAITALVLGIASLVLFCIPYVAILCAIAAIVFGVIGLKRAGKGMAIAGLILGIVALILYVFVILGSVALIGMSASVLEESLQELETLNTTMYY